jgi:hypothetical protein
VHLDLSAPQLDELIDLLKNIEDNEAMNVVDHNDISLTADADLSYSSNPYQLGPSYSSEKEWIKHSVSINAVKALILAGSHSNYEYGRKFVAVSLGKRVK